MSVSDKTLEMWLQEREPAVPGPFLPHLLGDPSVPPGVAELADLGEAALFRALGKPGRNRGAAFDLLAADAFLTYACEAGAEEADVRACLTALLEHLRERFT